jgi:hypothetical protein
MCEYLIRRTDALSRNQPDVAGQHRPGDITRCEEDGFGWGSKEDPPNFSVVKVPGVSKADGEVYAGPLTELVEEAPGEFTERTVLAGRYQFHLNSLSTLDRALFDLNQLSTSTETALRQIREKATDTSEWDRGKRAF